MNMTNFDNIQNLWQADKGASLPDSKEIITQIRKTRKKMLRRNIIGVVVLCLTFFYIIFVGWYYHFEKWTTRTGIIVVLVAIVMVIVFNSRLVQLLLKQEDITLDNRKYLEQLIHYRNTQHIIHFRGMVWYFILLTLGICLYMVEFAERSVYFGIAAYALTLGWIAFAWLYLMRRAKKKQAREVDMQIENLKRLVEKMEGE